MLKRSAGFAASLAVPIIAIAIVISLLLFVPKTRQTPKPTPSQTPLPKLSLPGISILVGVWINNNQSQIRTIDDNWPPAGQLAALPLNIKDVHLIDANHLVYIGSTDQTDYGTSIQKYDIKNKFSSAFFDAPEGWAIDDIVVSPNGNHITAWVVKWPDRKVDPKTPIGSRIYQFTFNDGPAKLVLEENSTPNQPIHYPVFQTNSGVTFVDTYDPFTQTYYKGLYQLQGSSLIQVLNNQDYTDVPKLTNHGNQVIFPKNAKLFPSAVDEGPTRPSISKPNVIAVYTFSNQTTAPIAGGEKDIIFDKPQIAPDDSAIYVQEFIKNEYKGIFALSLTGQVKNSDGTYGTKIVDHVLNPGEELLGISPDGKMLLVQTPDVMLGNLGETYSPLMKNLGALDLATKQVQPIDISNASFITISNKLTNPNDTTSKDKPKDQRQLKLETFTLRNVAQNRTTIPSCLDLDMETYGERWNELARHWQEGIVTEEDKELTKEIMEFRFQNRAAGKCADSPLYLYPNSPQAVSIKITRADVLASTPTYNDGFMVLAQPDGLLRTLAGETSHNLAYTYSSQKPFTEPAAGIVTSYADLENNLKLYALQLRLNNQERTDFVAFWLKQLPYAPYYKISHIEGEEADAHVHLDISPKPDSFLQVIMYFKPLDRLDLPANTPTFIPFARTGFTAVDWSGYIQR